MKDFTVVNIKELNKLPKETLPLVANITPLFTVLLSAPRGSNDLKEVKIIELDLETLIAPGIMIHDIVIVLLSLECHMSQSKVHRITRS